VRNRYAICLVLALLVGLGWLVWSGTTSPRIEDRIGADAAAGADAATVASTPASPAAAALTRTDEQASSAAVAAVPEPGPEELWGRVVVAGTTTPVANADVRLQHRDADEFWNLDLRYGEQLIELGRTTSGADGRFRFAVARAHQHRLQVRAAGFAPNTLVDCTGGAEVVVALSRGATVEGVVRSGGIGLADITVRIAVVGVSLDLGSARTDAGGAFRLTELQPASVYVQAGSPRHEEKWQRLDLRAGEVHQVEIELAAGRTLRGRVVEATTGTPIVDAEISDSWTFKRIVRSGLDGSFTLAGLQDGGFVEVNVRASGYATAARNLAGHLDAEAEFRLVGGGTVTGRFVTSSGVPVGAIYAAVGASYMETPGMQSSDWIPAVVGKDGRFQALGLRPDQHYWLYVRSAGHGTRVHALAGPVASGERLDVGDVVLRAAGGLEGRVVDDAGQPMAAVAVSISGTNRDSRAWLGKDLSPQVVSQFQDRSTRTDHRGRFRFTDLAGGAYAVSTHRGQSRAVWATAEVVDGEVLEGIELVVAVGAVIEGTLAFADGHAPGDDAAELHLQATGKSGESAGARIESSGHFRFAGLATDAYTLTLFNAPKGFAMSPRPDVPAGTTDLQLLLEPASVVAGRVVDADGKGLKAHVWVRAAEHSGGSPLLTTDDDGAFSIEVPPGFHGSVGARGLREVLLQATCDGVSAGQRDIVLTLKASGR